MIEVHCIIIKFIPEMHGAGQFYWWRKPEYQEEITDLRQVTTLVVIDTDM